MKNLRENWPLTITLIIVGAIAAGVSGHPILVGLLVGVVLATMI